MHPTRVKQKTLLNLKDYNDFWEKIVSHQIEKIYTTPAQYITAYEQDKDEVFIKILKQLHIIPIDIRSTLTAFYHRLKEPLKNLPA